MSTELYIATNSIEAFVDHPTWIGKISLIQDVLEELYSSYFQIVKGRDFLSSVQMRRLSQTISKSESLYSFSLRGTREPTSLAIETIKRQVGIVLEISHNSTYDQFNIAAYNSNLYREADPTDPFLRSFSQMMHFDNLVRTHQPNMRQVHFSGLINPSWVPYPY